jgi:hypothetical protein
MRHETKRKRRQPEGDAQENSSPGWSYQIDFRKCDIRRRMLAALDLPQ